MSDELDVSPEVFTADYVGQPGARTFYLQSRTATDSHAFLVEKQQVALLAEKLREVLLLIDETDTVAAAISARDPALALVEPVEAGWRVGTLGIGYEENGDYVLVIVSSSEGGEDAPDDEDAESIRFRLRRDQARAFVLHALAIVEEGRPLCQLCGLPMDPEGHICPASNGHRLTIV